MNEFLKSKIEYEKRRVTLEYIGELLRLKEEKGLKDINLFKKKGMWALKNIKPKLHITFGNAKLPKTTCIVNLGTWFNCAGRKEGFCEICEQCYDKSPEVRFKQRTKDRLEQEIFWRAVDTDTFADALMFNIIAHNDKSKDKVKLIRWAEVGEIRNQNDLEKIIDISNKVYENLGIESYIYTHNKNLNFNIEKQHLTINGSGFMVDNEYRVVRDKEKEYNNLNDISNKRDCICDCTQCSYCSKKDSYILIEELR